MSYVLRGTVPTAGTCDTKRISCQSRCLARLPMVGIKLGKLRLVPSCFLLSSAVLHSATLTRSQNNPTHEQCTSLRRKECYAAQNDRVQAYICQPPKAGAVHRHIQYHCPSSSASRTMLRSYSIYIQFGIARYTSVSWWDSHLHADNKPCDHCNCS